MLKILLLVFKVLTNLVNLFIRQKQIVQTIVSKDVVKRQHQIVQTGQCLRFECSEVKHVIRSNRWYVSARTKYTYEVKISQTREGTILNQFKIVYPNLTTNLMAGTSIPYLLAISAAVDWLLTGRIKDDFQGIQTP